MPQLYDTTIRLLSQEPLAGRVPTGDVLRVAEILDGAGFACLEVSGGGVFDAAVRRGVESPWERIRAIDARTTTPLGLALRGRFLVGSKPVSPDIVRRFVACAAENGIDVFRLHDPLNDVSNLVEAGEAIVEAGRQLHVGLVYSPGHAGEIDALVTQARKVGDAMWRQRAGGIVQDHARRAELGQLPGLLDEGLGLARAARAVDQTGVEGLARAGDRLARLAQVRDVVERVVEPEDVDPALGGGEHEPAHEVGADRP